MSSGLITTYLGQGLSAARPATPDLPSGGIAEYWSTDATVGQELSIYANGAWYTVNRQGGTSTWALAGAGHTTTGVWDFSADGATATIDFTGLTGSDILIIGYGLTQSAAGVFYVQVGNGGSFFTTSGDYSNIGSAGTLISNDSVALIDTTSTNARYGTCLISPANVSGVQKLITPGTRILPSIFTANTNPIDRVRIGKTGGGTFNGGKAYCLVR